MIGGDHRRQAREQTPLARLPRRRERCAAQVQRVAAQQQGQRPRPPRRQQRAARQRGHEQRGHQLAHRSRLPMFAHHERPPVAVLVLLRKQLGERRARHVPRADARALPDAAAGAAQAQVVLIVLVAHQLLVKAAHALERGARPAAEIHGVGLALIRRIARARAAHHPAALKGGGNRPAPRALPACDPRAAHVVGARARQRGQAFGHVVGREHGVHVQPHDDGAARGGQRGVEAGRDDAVGVVDDAQARILRGAGVEPRARAVVACAVGHQQFHLPAGRQLLGECAVAEGIDVVALVAAGGDEADALRLAHARAFDASSWR